MSESRFLSAPSRASMQTLEAVRNAAGGFDVDAWHVMEKRDDEMIRQEILYGTGSSKYVYSFKMGGTDVAGISVIGARELASHYGGLRHRLVASVQKIGSLFTFTSYPFAGSPMNVQAQFIEALAKEEDYYEVVVEVDDVKKGNTIQMRKLERKREFNSQGVAYDRPHYAVIAESKAYRNAVLTLVTQSVQLEWKMAMLKLKKDEVITGSVLEEKRSGVLRFAASKSIPISRQELEALTFDQLSGLGDAARSGGADEFRRAADAVGVLLTPQPVDQDRAPARTALAAASGEGGKAAAKPAQTQEGRKAAPVATPAASAASQAPPPASAAANAPASTPAATPPPAQAASAEPDFQEYIADEDGEFAVDGDGNTEQFETPAAYLRAMQNRAENSDRLPVLLDNNTDGIEKARTLDPQAGQRFDDAVAALLFPKTRTAPEPPPAAATPAEAAPPAAAAPPATAAPPHDHTAHIPIPMKGNRPDLAAYRALIAAALEHIDTQSDLTKWQGANKDAIASLPTVTKREVSKAIAACAEKIVDRTNAARPPAEERQILVDIAEDLMTEISGTKTLADLQSWDVMRPTVLRVEKLPPDLREKVGNFAKGHRNMLRERQA